MVRLFDDAVVFVDVDDADVVVNVDVDVVLLSRNFDDKKGAKWLEILQIGYLKNTSFSKTIYLEAT